MDKPRNRQKSNPRETLNGTNEGETQPQASQPSVGTTSAASARASERFLGFWTGLLQFWMGLIRALPKLKTGIQLVGFVVLVAGFISYREVSQDKVPGVIATGGIGLLLLIFGLTLWLVGKVKALQSSVFISIMFLLVRMFVFALFFVSIYFLSSRSNLGPNNWSKFPAPFENLPASFDFTHTINDMESKKISGHTIQGSIIVDMIFVLTKEKNDATSRIAEFHGKVEMDVFSNQSQVASLEKNYNLHFQGYMDEKYKFIPKRFTFTVEKFYDANRKSSTFDKGEDFDDMQVATGIFLRILEEKIKKYSQK